MTILDGTTHFESPPDRRTYARSTNADPVTTVFAVRDVPMLRRFIPAWEDLAAATMERNVFYEHWMLLPALEAFGEGRDIAVVMVMLRDPSATRSPPRLAGLFPVERLRPFGNRSMPATSLWQHPHCYLCTPLVRATAAPLALAAFFRWMRAGTTRATLAHLKWVSRDGPFDRTLTAVASELGMERWTTEAFTRAVWRNGATPGQDPERAISGQLRRQLRRKERRLAESGRVEHVMLQQDGDVERWIADFLRLESSGWKGQRGTALACSRGGRRFFAASAASAFQQNRLLLLGLDFNGQPIARRCAFRAGQGAFAFKTAYDERFAAYSPGAILEQDSIRQLRSLPGASWMDSCAAPDNPLINRMANARIAMQSVVVGHREAPVDRIEADLPLVRWAQRRLARKSPQDA